MRRILEVLAEVAPAGVEFRLHHMSESRRFPIAPGRKTGAWVCLIALMLLWSPVWAAAWQSTRMSCCDGGMCAAQGHTKHIYDSEPATSRQSPITCEHRGGSDIDQCSMSCCRSESPSLVASIVFVLPPALLLSRSPNFVTSFVPGAKREILPATKPPDRPPRLLPS